MKISYIIKVPSLFIETSLKEEKSECQTVSHSYVGRIYDENFLVFIGLKISSTASWWWYVKKCPHCQIRLYF